MENNWQSLAIEQGEEGRWQGAAETKEERRSLGRKYVRRGQMEWESDERHLQPPKPVF